MRGVVEMRFRVGDKVKIVNNLTTVDAGKCGVVYDMYEYVGMIATVDDVGAYFYVLSVDDNKWRWNENTVEVIEEELKCAL